MRYPIPVVVALILNKKGEMFIARSHKYKGRFGLPGGKVDYKEAVERALKREMREETGLSIDVVRVLTAEDVVRPRGFFSDEHYVLIVYLCRAQSMRVRLDRRELQEYMWIKPGDALKRRDLEPYARKFIGEYLKAKR